MPEAVLLDTLLYAPVQIGGPEKIFALFLNNARES